MDPLIQLAAGISAIALGSIAYSLVPISESAKNFNYCVEQNVAWWEEQDGQLHPWTRSNQVAFYNGKIFEVEVNNLDALKKSKL